MTSYNGEAFIEKQIRSILPQLSQADELIIGDDCSGDRSVEIIESIADPRITLYKNEKNGGLNRNISQILSRSRGDYIFLCDQDDIWLPGKVHCCLYSLKTDDLVIHNAIFIDQNDNPLNETTFQRFFPSSSYLNNLISNKYIGACMAFRRTLLTPLLPLGDNIPMHDWYIAQHALRYGKKIKTERKELILYRRHRGNLSATAEGKSTASLFTKLKWRYDILRKTFFYN